MANEQATLVIGSIKAASDLSTTGRYRFAKIGSGGTIALAGVDTRADGIIQNKPAAAEPVNLAIAGVALLELGTGGCTAGDNIASGANGTGVLADSGAMVLAKALQTGVVGDVVAVIFNPSGPTY